jgi:hypothetical protein
MERERESVELVHEMSFKFTAFDVKCHGTFVPSEAEGEIVSLQRLVTRCPTKPLCFLSTLSCCFRVGVIRRISCSFHFGFISVSMSICWDFPSLLLSTLLARPNHGKHNARCGIEKDNNEP